MLAGVTIVQPATHERSTSSVAIGEDTVIEPCTQLRGARAIGAGATVGPHSTLIDARVGDGVTRRALPPRPLRGPRRRERRPVRLPAPRTRCCARARRSARSSRSRTPTSAPGAKVPAPLLRRRRRRRRATRTSAPATITANYDGAAKHRTTIGARVHGGVDTSFVAPVTVGDDAWTAAGSVVTDDVPAGALAVARARQRNVERYAERRETRAPPAARGAAGAATRLHRR